MKYKKYHPNMVKTALNTRHIIYHNSNIICCGILFFALNKFTKNKIRSVIGTIIGFIGALIIGIAIPINTEVIVFRIMKIGGIYAGIIYFVIMTTFIGLIVTHAIKIISKQA